MIKDSQEGVLNKLDRLIKESNFKELWEANDRDGLFDLCNLIRDTMEVPVYDAKKLDEGWQYRTILHPEFEVAREEFYNFVFGWW